MTLRRRSMFSIAAGILVRHSSRNAGSRLAIGIESSRSNRRRNASTSAMVFDVSL
jgi:hypothetical protein